MATYLAGKSKEYKRSLIDLKVNRWHTRPHNCTCAQALIQNYHKQAQEHTHTQRHTQLQTNSFRHTLSHSQQKIHDCCRFTPKQPCTSSRLAFSSPVSLSFLPLCHALSPLGT